MTNMPMTEYRMWLAPVFRSSSLSAFLINLNIPHKKYMKAAPNKNIRHGSIMFDMIGARADAKTEFEVIEG